MPSYALETMERAARYADRAVCLFEDEVTGRPTEDDRAKRSELEMALYWSALNFSTLCGLQGGSLDKAQCAQRVRHAVRRLRELLAECGTGQTVGAARLAFIAGVFDFNIATHCERCSAAPSAAFEGVSLEGDDAAAAAACESGTEAAARLLARSLARFREAHRVWHGVKGTGDLDTAASVTMVAACLARLGRVEEAAEWATRDYETRLRVQVPRPRLGLARRQALGPLLPFWRVVISIGALLGRLKRRWCWRGGGLWRRQGERNAPGARTPQPGRRV